MTESEAIQVLNGNIDDINKVVIARGVAVLSLQEIQQYRALGTVEELREAMEKQRWIPCSDNNLPEKEVLCCDKYGEMMFGYVFKTEDETYNAESEHEYMYDCVAWQPLPEPYKEGDEG